MINDIEDTELPQNVKAILQEHTAGGFILFRVGSTGKVEVTMDFDNTIFYYALVNKGKMHLESLLEAEKTLLVENMVMEFGGGYDHEDEDEDEDPGDDDENWKKDSGDDEP